MLSLFLDCLSLSYLIFDHVFVESQPKWNRRSLWEWSKRALKILETDYSIAYNKGDKGAKKQEIR